MQLFVLLMILGLMFAADGGGWAVEPMLTGWLMPVVAMGPYGLMFLIGWGMCGRALGRLRTHRHRASKVLNRLNLGLTGLRWLMLLFFLSTLFVLGWRGWLVGQTGDWIVLNDAVILTGPVITLIGLWWAQYPIDRRLREQSLIRELDSGQPIFSFHTRRQFVIEQIRHQLLIVLGPMLVIVAWVQSVDRYASVEAMGEGAYIAMVAGGGVTVFVFAPVMIRYMWRTIPMPAGSLRDRLMAMCDMHRVRVRQLLLWQTHAGLINGAVVGLIAPLRYIMLTDGLIDRLKESHVEAVMAHELGHVRRRHMPWLAVCALATLGGMAWLLDAVLWTIDASEWLTGMEDLLREGGMGGTTVQTGTLGALMFLMILLWASAFGFISRRFERQADTFAVQHLTLADDQTHITEQAVGTMSQALQAVCEQNHHPTDRKSWRHGSIDWRIAYLQTLIGRPVHQCPIDRHVRLLCWACALLLAATLFAQ